MIRLQHMKYMKNNAIVEILDITGCHMLSLATAEHGPFSGCFTALRQVPVQKIL